MKERMIKKGSKMIEIELIEYNDSIYVQADNQLLS